MVSLAGKYDPDVASNSNPPEGEYVAELVGAEVVPVSQAANKGEALALTWKIKEGEHEGRHITQRLMLWFEGNNAPTVRRVAEERFASIREATGVKRPEDSSDLYYIPCVIRYGPQKKDPNYSDVKGVAAYDGVPPEFEGLKAMEPRKTSGLTANDMVPPHMQDREQQAAPEKPKSNPFKKG